MVIDGSILIRFARPKIQRLVTPIRLQRRRHLRALNRRRFDRQKEQKAEYEYVSMRGFLCMRLIFTHP